MSNQSMKTKRFKPIREVTELIRFLQDKLGGSKLAPWEKVPYAVYVQTGPFVRRTRINVKSPYHG
jgi:hypothetical protein